MFLWIVDVIGAAVLAEYAGLMNALLFGAIWTGFFWISDLGYAETA